jgi:hypothetical protein
MSIQQLRSELAQLHETTKIEEQGWKNNEDARRQAAATEKAELQVALAQAEDEERKMAYAEDVGNRQESSTSGKSVFQ